MNEPCLSITGMLIKSIASEIYERSERSKSLVTFNVRETYPIDRFKYDFLSLFGIAPNCASFSRLRKPSLDKSRPILAKFVDQIPAQHVLEYKHLLASSTCFKSVFIKADQSPLRRKFGASKALEASRTNAKQCIH